MRKTVTQLDVQLHFVETEALMHRDQNEKRNSLMLDPNISGGAEDIMISTHLPDISVRGMLSHQRSRKMTHP